MRINDNTRFWIAWTLAVLMIVGFRINKNYNQQTKPTNEPNKSIITHNEHPSQPVRDEQNIRGQ